MSLVNCPECGNQVSTKATACPSCGAPIKDKTDYHQEVNVNLKELEFPTNLPSNLNIGKHFDLVYGYGSNRELKVVYDAEANNRKLYPEDNDLTIKIHARGILLDNFWGGNQMYTSIHFDRIIDFKYASEEELKKIKKSVIGRGAVGLVLLGPVGAIVGGMSGIGSKEKKVINSYILLSYWDIKTREPIGLVLTSTSKNVAEFFDNYKTAYSAHEEIKQSKERFIAFYKKTEAQNLEEKTGCAKIGVGIILFIAFAIFPAIF